MKRLALALAVTIMLVGCRNYDTMSSIRPIEFGPGITPAAAPTPTPTFFNTIHPVPVRTPRK